MTNKAASGTVLSSFAYQYNADSLKQSATEADGSAVTYGYDGLLHLSSETRTGTAPYSASYAVDGAGQRTAQTTNGVTTTLTYDADAELLSTAGGFTNSYGYNADGDQTARTLSGTAYTLAYDYDDQLTSTGGASFAYDAAGRRVSRTAGGVITSFLYDGESVLLEQQGGATTASYSYGNALTRKDGETPLFDGQGSERTVTNAGGAVQATLALSAFGQAVASSGSSSDPYQYAATSRYRNDGDAGLSLVGCRYYDAQTGAFISRDTYLDQLAYAYCDADPVNKVDPSGHTSYGLGLIVRGIATLANLIETNFEKEIGPVDQLPQNYPEAAMPNPGPPGISRGGVGSGGGPDPVGVGEGTGAAEAGEGYEIAGTFFVDSATLAEATEVAAVILIV